MRLALFSEIIRAEIKKLKHSVRVTRVRKAPARTAEFEAKVNKFKNYSKTNLTAGKTSQDISRHSRMNKLNDFLDSTEGKSNRKLDNLSNSEDDDVPKNVKKSKAAKAKS